MLLISIKLWMGRGERWESEGEKRGGELEGENKRGGGVRGYFTALEGLVGWGKSAVK